MMSTIVFALAMAAPAKNIGPAIAGAPNCYAVNDRYVACALYDESGELLRIKVKPRVWLSEEDNFDRDQALSQAEYLDVMAKIGRAVDIGEYQLDEMPHAYAIMNGLIAPVEEWANAAVRKWIVDGPDTVLAIDVFFYRKVSGSVSLKLCDPDSHDDRCPELSLKPHYVTIGDVEYLVAPRDRRKFTLDETVEIFATDLKD